MLLLGVEKYAKSFLYEYSLLMVLSGVLILLFGRFILKDFDNSILKQILANSVGLTLLIVGIDYFLEQYMAKYGFAYLIFALILFQYRDKLTGG